MTGDSVSMSAGDFATCAQKKLFHMDRNRSDDPMDLLASVGLSLPELGETKTLERALAKTLQRALAKTL